MEGDVLWEPYEEFLAEDLNLAPPTVLGEQHLWFARVEMIHFWMVEFHYPDRVMRQFGRKQLVPPPLPEPWEGHEANMLYKHTKECHKTKPDWALIHAATIQEWAMIEYKSVDPGEVWDPDCMEDYMLWYGMYGKPSVMIRTEIVQGLPAELPRPSRAELPTMSYPARHQQRPRLVERILADAAYGIKLVATKAGKKIGKWMLRSCRTKLEDVGEVHRMDDLYEQHNFSAAVETEPDSPDDEVPAGPTLEDYDDSWAGYLFGVGAQGDVYTQGEITQATPPPTQYPDQGAGTSTPGAAKRRRAMRPGRGEPAPKYTPS